jgi:hypothetical protein
MTTSDSALAQHKISDADVDKDIKKKALSKANSESTTQYLRVQDKT